MTVRIFMYKSAECLLNQRIKPNFNLNKGSHKTTTASHTNCDANITNKLGAVKQNLKKSGRGVPVPIKLTVLVTNIRFLNYFMSYSVFDCKVMVTNVNALVIRSTIVNFPSDNGLFSDDVIVS